MDQDVAALKNCLERKELELCILATEAKIEALKRQSAPTPFRATLGLLRKPFTSAAVRGRLSAFVNSYWSALLGTEQEFAAPCCVQDLEEQIARLQDEVNLAEHEKNEALEELAVLKAEVAEKDGKRAESQERSPEGAHEGGAVLVRGFKVVG